jgi:hypothetical protein
MGNLEQGARAGFPARKRWEACFLATLLFAIFPLVSSVSARSFQGTKPATNPAKATPAGPTAPAAQQPKPATDTTRSSAVEKPKPQKKPTWRVKVISDVPIPSISVHAKNVPLSTITAEIERQLKVPVVLTTKMREEQLTTDFENFPVEAAVKLLAPRAIIDYIITGGNGSMPSRKEPKSIYLMAYDEKPPRVGPWMANRSGAELVVGVVYATEEEEKAAMEIKERDLQVKFKDDLFTVKVHKQYLTDVLQEIADKAGIPFAILATDGSQREIDEVVSWSIDNASLEELARTWFPNGIRLYWRTDLESFVSKPLRITIENNSGVQAEQPAEQNVTP